MSSGFDRVYPFTTEKIDGYFKYLDLEDKSVLTVGSSGDQALNALTMGAGRVVLFDINPSTEKFYKLKRDLILNSSREDLYQKVLSLKDINFSPDLFAMQDLEKMNTYMKDDESYHKLQEILAKKEIEFVQGNIFDFASSIGNEKFDRIIFSNILQYRDMFAKSAGYEGREDEFLRENFEEWIKHLNKDGLLQLLYYYCFNVNIRDYCRVCYNLEEYNLYSQLLDRNDSRTDAIVLYKRSR